MTRHPCKTPRLSTRQEAFSQYVADGLTLSEAYRRAYGSKAASSTIRAEASRLAASRTVAGRIADLKAETAAIKLADRTAKRRVLAQMICDRDLAASDRREAIKIDNAMTGDNAPVKVEGEITIFSILKDIEPTTGLPSADAKRR